MDTLGYREQDTQKDHQVYNNVYEEVTERFHVELIPGTEVLTKTELSAEGLVESGKQGVILVPQPHNDIHDPLNWNRFWKLATLLNCAVLTFIGDFTALSLAPLYPLLAKSFDTTVPRAALLTGGTVLSLGLANFVIVPCTNVFGRRNTILVCSAIAFAANIWQAVATSYESMLGGRVLVGIGAATSESLMPIVISDIVFLHERGTWMGIWLWSFCLGAYIGPVVAGAITFGASWRWFFWLATIIQGINFVSMVFTLPETKYVREQQLDQYRHSTGAATALEPQSTIEPGKQTVETAEDTPMDVEVQQRASLLGHGYPTKAQRWGLTPVAFDSATLKHVLRDLYLPFQIATFPIVLFGACCLAFGCNMLLILNLLESSAFSAPPWNFTPFQVGLTNFAFLVGAVIGVLTAGPSSDWVSMKLTKRNHGIREPEMRLYSFIPFICFGVIGMTVTCVGWENKYAWEVITICGMVPVGIAVLAIPTIGLSYAIDSYKPVAGEIMVVGTVIRNMYAYGMSYYDISWALRDGFIKPVMVNAAEGLGVPALGIIVFVIFGKRLRRFTRDSKVHSF